MKPYKTPILIVVFLLSAALFFSNTTSLDAHHGDTNALVERTAVPDPFKNFSARTSDNRSVQLSDYQGKIIFLNFWATWCVPCRLEMPAMQFLQRKLNDPNFIILTVNKEESPEQVRRYNKELKLNFESLLDVNGEINRLYNVVALPTTYIIDKQGFMIARAVGPRPWDGEESIKYFKHLLAAKPKAKKKSWLPSFKDWLGK